ncbi:hypothetical protein SS50377_28405 [Spironucleus salmonicida]|uniref:Uncharacterized protein n=1 Tax=Spironucleus salmonicida TaxID=348837 RepID=V6LF84_9EUKA|nr:hypothetical protein SS50377_28405 [Spironucleus salmonicida]|eukprot:EST43180.1 hypothetical protein SS50377_17121 [Spironucleus salmonicida]
MPPKPDEKAIADAAKLFKKQLDEAKQKQLEFNTKEFARLNKVKTLILNHWTEIANYVATTSLNDKQSLQTESQDFSNFLRKISAERKSEIELISTELNWQQFKQQTQTAENDLIPALDTLLSALKSDSTVFSLQKNLSQNPTLRNIIEQKESIYEIFLAAVTEICDQLAKLEKFIDLECKNEQFLQKIVRSFPKKQLVNDKVGDLLILSDLGQQQTELFDLFTVRNEFVANDENQIIVDMTLKNELFKANPVPKIQEFDEKMNLISGVKKEAEKDSKEPVKQETAPPKKKGKKGKKVEKEPVKEEVDDEILQLHSVISTRIEHFKEFQQPSEAQDLLNKLLVQTLNLEIPALPETEELIAEQQIHRKNELQLLKQQLLTIKPTFTLPTSPVDQSQFQKIAHYQSVRVLYRAYLFDFLDLSTKQIIENPENYGELNEILKLSYPKKFENENQEESEHSISSQNSSSNEEENSTENAQKNSLNFENLQKLNQKPDIEVEEKVEQFDFQEDKIRVQVTNNQDEFDMKFAAFRPRKTNYNKQNITSLNEQIAIFNNEKKFNSVRIQLEDQYVKLVLNKAFQTNNSSQISRLLAKILSSEKVYFGEIYTPKLFKIPYLTLQERVLLSQSGTEIEAKASDKIRLEKIQQKIQMLNQLNNLNIHALPFTQGVVVTANQGKGKMMKINFSSALKIAIPGILSMSNLCIRMNVFDVKLTSQNDGFECLISEIEGVENQNLINFFEKREVQNVGEKTLIQLIKEMGTRYLKDQSEINENTQIQEEASKIDKLQGVKSVNIIQLFEMRTSLKQKIADLKIQLKTTIQELFTSNIYSLKDNNYIVQYIILIKGIRFLETEIENLNMKIVKSHYSVILKSQSNELLTVKGKKQKIQLQDAQIKQNSEILKQYFQMLKTDVLDLDFFNNSLENLTLQSANLKSKGKNKFEIPKIETFYEKVEGTNSNYYITPDIVQISKSFQIDVIRVPQIQQEINNWMPKLLLNDDINTTIQGHQAYEFDDQSLDIQLGLETPQKYVISRPVKDQIKLLREILRSKKSQNNPQKVDICSEINSEKYVPATTFYVKKEAPVSQQYNVINMIKQLPVITPKSSHITDYYIRNNNNNIQKLFNFFEETGETVKQGKQKDFYLNPKPFIDYFIYPSSSSQQFNSYPGFPLLKISEIAKERAKYSIFDSVLTWNSIININQDQNSVINPVLNQETEDKSNQYIIIDIQLSNELQCGIRQILDVQETTQYLQQAYLFQDFSSLLGAYFVGFYNSQTQTFDPDGVISVNYKPENGFLTLKVFKTGIFGICQIRQNLSVIRGWAAFPEDNRGDGYSMREANLEIQKYNVNINVQQQQLGNSTAFNSSMNYTSIQQQQFNTKQTRFSYFSPDQILQRSGKLADIPTMFDAQDLHVNFFVNRALQLQSQNQIQTHSVILRLALASNVILTLRILPEGFEIFDISTLKKCEIQNENCAEYVDFDEFKVESQNYNQIKVNVPVSIANSVFNSVQELAYVLAKIGIFLSPLTDFEIQQLKITPKTSEIEVEFARQIAVLLTMSNNGKSTLNSIFHSTWNRNLPSTIKSFPETNMFQTLQDEFDMSNFMIRGMLPPEDIPNYVNSELKRLKKEKKDMKNWMKEQRSVDEKAARKAVTTKVDQKVEKGAPSALGPGVYGMKTEAVEKRQKAIDDIISYMEEYLSAVDLIREVKYENSACFVLNSTQVKITSEKASVNALVMHQQLLENLEFPKKAGTRPDLPLTVSEQKKKAKLEKLKKKEAENIVENEVEEVQEPRCTQVKPFQVNSGEEFTICINKSRFDAFTVRASAVPVDGPKVEGEEFCNMSIDGTEAHASVFGLFGMSGADCQCDPLLVGKVYELICFLRLGSLG